MFRIIWFQNGSNKKNYSVIQRLLMGRKLLKISSACGFFNLGWTSASFQSSWKCPVCKKLSILVSTGNSTFRQSSECIWKITHLNRGYRYEDIIDHRSYTHNLSSCETIEWKKTDSGLNGIRTHDLPALPTELSSHLGAGHVVSL